VPTTAPESDTGLASIATGEWIIIILTVIILVLTAVGVMIGYWVLTARRTEMHCAGWQIMRNTEKSTILVSYNVEFFPIADAFRILGMGCKIWFGGRWIRILGRSRVFFGREVLLRASEQTVGQVKGHGPYQGSQSLNFVWESEPEDIPGDPVGVAEVRVELSDGSKLREKLWFSALSSFLHGTPSVIRTRR